MDKDIAFVVIGHHLRIEQAQHLSNQLHAHLFAAGGR